MIPIKPNPNPHIKKTLDTNVTVDENSQFFATPRKNNHSTTEPSTQVLLVSDTLPYQQNTTTHMIHKKLPPSGKYYICFRTDKNPG